MFIPGISVSGRKIYRKRGGISSGGGGASGGGGGGSKGGSSTGSTSSSSSSKSGGTTNSGGATNSGSTSSGKTGGTSSTGSTGSSNGKTSGSSNSGNNVNSGSTPSIGSPKSIPLSGSVAGGRSSAVAYGSGTAKQITIPSGQLFAGRIAGGASRNQIFGNSRYGSGYPGISGLGVAGRGFPFFFWPVIYGSIIGGTIDGYLDDGEYGNSSNSSRPGGPLVQAPFQSASSNNTFHVVADNSTVVSLIASINANCSSLLSSSANSTVAEAYNSTQPNEPQPEQAVQYYRSSSIVLTEDGYNNSATISNDSNAPNTPLPNFTDTMLLDCLNQTIGAAAPLIDGSSTLFDHSRLGVGSVSIFWTLWMVLTIL